MEFKVDENLPVRWAGYDAATVVEQHLEAGPIPTSVCQKEGHVLVTLRPLSGHGRHDVLWWR